MVIKHIITLIPIINCKIPCTMDEPLLVGGFNPFEKYQSVGMIIPIHYGQTFQTTNHIKILINSKVDIRTVRDTNINPCITLQVILTLFNPCSYRIFPQRNPIRTVLVDYWKINNNLSKARTIAGGLLSGLSPINTMLTSIDDIYQPSLNITWLLNLGYYGIVDSL